MNITRSICRIQQGNVPTNFYRSFRFSSKNYKSSTITQPQIQEEKFDFEDLQIHERQHRRKASIKPFMKNIFASIFNTDLLAYPEILNKEEFETLNNNVAKLQAVFHDKKKSDKIKALKKTKMYSANMKLTDNGLDINTTESLRLLESMSSDLPLSLEISNHWVALEVLKKGLERNYFLNIKDDLAAGDNTVSLCIKEKLSERLLQPDFKTRAELDGQGVWHINGEKVSFKGTGYLLVLCSVDADRIKAFLVHPGSQGVNYEKGFVSFLNTPATPIDLISEENLGQLLAISRLHIATLTRCCLTRAMHTAIEYARSKVLGGKPLAELVTIKTLIGNTLMHIYASESAEYFTAGLLDGYENPDTDVESAMCRNFMASCGPSLMIDLLNICALERKEEFDKLFADMQHVLSCGDTIDGINMFISLHGVRHASLLLGSQYSQIKKTSVSVFKQLFKNYRRQEIDDPKLNLHLEEYLHPSLKQPAMELEYCVVRMRYAYEVLLQRHDKDVITAYTELNRLAEAATGILVMTASLARASRSYCIGIRNAEIEMKLAASFVTQTKRKVRDLILDIDDGQHLNLDFFKNHFGEKIFKNDSNTTIVMNPTDIFSSDVQDENE